MKHSVCIVVLCILATIGIALGCSKKEAVDPSQELVHEQFPKDQDAVCNPFFDSSSALGKILRDENCESLSKSLESVPPEVLDNYEKGVMGCRYLYMTKQEMSEILKTAQPNFVNQIKDVMATDKLLYRNACTNVEVPPRTYLEFKARMEKMVPAFHKKMVLVASCGFYEGLSRVLSDHKENCDEAAVAFGEYLDKNLDDFNRAIHVQESMDVHLFDTADGQREYGRCYSQISYPDSPYMACIQAQNMNFIRQNARMMQVTTDIQRAKLNNQAALEGGNPYVSVEKSYMEGFARNVEVTDGNCENMGTHLNRFVDAIESGMDLVRAQDLTRELDPDLGPAKNRKKMIQDTFGKNAPVQKCMGNAEVRKAYDKMVDGLKIRSLIEL